MSRWEDPRTQLAVAGVALAALLGPLLVADGVDVPDDALYYALPSWEWLRHALATGTSPWWVPGKLGGVSLFADVVPMGPFYPGVLPGLVAPALPALLVVTILHGIGTFVATRWAVRVHGASSASATIAGLAIAVGPIGASAVIDAQFDSWPAFVWFPVVLGCLHLAAEAEGRRRRRLLAAGGAAIALLLLGTHLRVAATAGAALALWAVVRGRDLRGAAIAGGLGLLAGAPGYVPMLLELGEAGARGGGLPVDQALGLGNLAGWLAPTPRVLVRDLTPGPVLAVAFVLGALRVVPLRDRRMVLWALLLFGAGASAVPGLRWVFAPLRVVSSPVDLVYAALALYPAAILGAQALDRLTEIPAPALVRRLRAGAAPMAVLGLFALATLARPLARWLLGSEAPVGTSALGAAQAAATLALVVVIFRSVESADRRRGLLLLVAAADVALFSIRAHAVVPSTPLVPASAIRTDPALLADGYLDIQDLAQGFDSALTAAGEADVRTGVEWDVRVPEIDAPAQQADLLGRAIPPHYGVATGIRGVAGRSKLPPARQIAALTPLADQLQTVQGDDDVLRALFGTPDGLGTRTMALHAVPVAVWGDEIAFRSPAPPPPCWFPTRWERVDDPSARVEASLAAGLELGVLESADSPGLPGGATCSVDGGRVVVRADREVVVVLPERTHAGRRAETASGTLRTFPVNQVQTGVVVPAGTTSFRLRFRPPGLVGTLAAGAVGWMLLLGLGAGLPRRDPRTTLTALALTAVLAGTLAAPAAAAELRGSVAPLDPSSTHEVLVVGSLDLAEPPLATVPVREDGTWVAEYDEPDGDVWVFLRQRILRPDGPTVTFHLPHDLAPVPPRGPRGFVRFRALPRGPALARADGGPLAGWWMAPVLLVLLLYGGGLLGLRLLRPAAPAPGPGPRTASIGPGAGRRTGAPRAGGEAPPMVPGERMGLIAILVAAAIARIPRLVSGPLELIEHTYGPGSRRIVPVDVDGTIATPLGERVLQAVLEPASLEVTHPPLWHALLSGIGAITDAAWALRLPSFAASLATVWVLHRLLRRVDPTAGLLAAGLYALTATGVHPGADATPYAFTALVSVGSIELMIRALEQGTPGSWRAWVGCLVAGFLCHYTVAILGAAQVVAVSVFVARRRDDPRWAEAGRSALKAALLLAPLPLGWSFLHFASFATVALDTRLFASVYPLDPGRWAFLGEFATVTAGAHPGDGPGGALLGFGLAAVGLVAVLRRDAQIGLLLLAAAAAWAGGTFFFHANLVDHLDGRVFYGFRWVSWFAPLLMGCGALGVVFAFRAGRVERLLVVAAGLLWTLSAFRLAIAPAASPRPAYDDAADRILAELADRDAVAVLPLWGQRGPLSHYLTRGDARLVDREDGVAWEIDGKRVFLEAIDEALPFETSATNGHFHRLWVGVVDERMFGRAKFSADAAARALQWADDHLLPDGSWSFEHLELRRYRVPPTPPGRVRVTDPSEDMRSVRFLEPNAPTCTDQGLEEGAEPRHRLNVRIVSPGGRVHAETIEGGPCTDPPPEVFFDL